VSACAATLGAAARAAARGGHVSDRVIENPIINSPYRAPNKHFAFDNYGITDRIMDGRRPSSYFVPVPRPRKTSAGQQMAFDELTADQIKKNDFVNQIRARVDRWRDLGQPDVTPVTRRLLEYWSDPDRYIRSCSANSRPSRPLSTWPR
jgi:type III restriction enzyme